MNINTAGYIENRFFEIVSFLSLNVNIFKNVISDKLNSNIKCATLDFGCGTGMFCDLFDKEGYLGVDINEKRILFARHKHPGYRFEKFESLDQLRHKKFDKILCLGVLHHINNEMILQLMQDFREMLDDNGLLLAIEPTFTNSIFRNKLIEKLDRGAYVRRKNEYLDLMERYFEVEISMVNPPLIAHLWSSDIAYCMKKK